MTLFFRGAHRSGGLSLPIVAGALCAGAAGLAACAAIDGVGFGDAAPLVTPVRSAGAPAAARSQIVAFSTSDGAGRPAPGAQCQAVSRDLSAEFRTPARLSLPLDDGATAPILVICRHPTAGRAQITAAPERPAAKSDGFFELITSDLFGQAPENALAYPGAYRLILSADAPPASAPPPPAAVEAAPLPPVQTPPQ